MPTIITSQIRGRLGSYTLSIDDESTNPVSWSLTPDILSDEVKVRFGESKAGYGKSVVASFLELTFHDPTRQIRDLFAADFIEEHYPVTITGPNLDWHGIVYKGSIRGLISDRIAPDKVTLYAYDGLGSLKNQSGDRIFHVSVGDVLRNIFARANNFIGVYAYFDTSPTFFVDNVVDELRFDEEITSEQGFNGTLRDQLEAIASFFGCRAYQAFSDGTWRFVHRSSEARDVTGFFAIGDTWSSAPIPRRVATANTRTLRGSKNDVTKTEPAASNIVVNDRRPDNLVVDGVFDHTDASGSLIFWNSDNITFDPTLEGYIILGNPVASPPDGFVWQQIQQVYADPDVHLSFSYDTEDLVSGAFGVTYRLIGDTETYYLTNNGDWQVQEHIFTAQELDIPASEPIPIDGFIRIDAQGEGNARWGLVESFYVDENGDRLEDMGFLAAGRPYNGETLELGAAIQMQKHTDRSAPDEWIDIVQWESIVYDDVYFDLDVYRATNRFEQQAPGLTSMEALALDGLYGPETLIDLTLRGVNYKMLLTGGEINLVSGTTKLIAYQIADALLPVGS